MLANSLKKTHTITSGLQEVHSRMLMKFNIANSQEVAIAKKLQTYLQYFKKIFNHPENYMTDDPLLAALGLDEEAIKEMRTRFQQVLQVTDKYNQIFRSQHNWYNNRTDFDDIVEGEVNALLQVMAEKATGVKNIDLGQKIVGNISAIVDMPQEIGTEMVDKLVESFHGKLSTKKATKLLEELHVSARAGKIDVAGYNKDLVLTANIIPQFQEFIDLFSSINFSIKNYKGDGAYDIHLGKTSPFKAMYGSLTSLGYSHEDAIHIYTHSRISYQQKKNMVARNNDIFHLRFMYELTGSGLVSILGDGGKQDLGAADYLIYNDPVSDNIFVKSTKQMINEIITSKNMKVSNPWAGVYVSKVSFN